MVGKPALKSQSTDRPSFIETYEDYARAALRDRFHEDHPQKANGLLKELGNYRDPALGLDREGHRHGSSEMYPSDEEDIRGCLPRLRIAMAGLDDPAPPPPVPDLGRIGTVYILTHPSFTAWVKIGFSTLDVSRRAKNYSNKHEFDEHWQTAWSLRTPRAKAVEGAVHG